MEESKINMNVVCFGEVLIDQFPTHSKIGGAPLNVSVRLQSYGAQVAMISSVGSDKEGEKILDFLKDHDVDTAGIAVQNNYPTGKVNVFLNDEGSANYEIAYPAAWDKIEISDELHTLVKNSDLFIFGSLVCRDELSGQTLDALLQSASYKVFDVNLRAPHYSNERLIELMKKADFIKFNDDELYEIADYLKSKYHSMEQTIAFIAKEMNTETICVTKGAYGAVLYYAGKFYYNSGYRIKVIDTVGSGDSFLASIIYKLFNKENPQEALNFGCAVGALVAGTKGASTILSTEKITQFMHP